MPKFRNDAGSSRKASYKWDAKPENKYKRQRKSIEGDITKLAVKIFTNDFSKPDFVMFGEGRSPFSLAMPSKQSEWNKLFGERQDLLGRIERKRLSSQDQKEHAQNTTAAKYPQLAMTHCPRAFGTLPLSVQAKHDPSFAVLRSFGQGAGGQFSPLPKGTSAISIPPPPIPKTVVIKSESQAPKIKRELEAGSGDDEVVATKKIKSEPQSDDNADGSFDERESNSAASNHAADAALSASNERACLSNAMSDQQDAASTTTSNGQCSRTISQSTEQFNAKLAKSNFDHSQKAIVSDDDRSESDLEDGAQVTASKCESTLGLPTSKDEHNAELVKSNEAQGKELAKSKEEQNAELIKSKEEQNAELLGSKEEQNVQPAKSNGKQSAQPVKSKEEQVAELLGSKEEQNVQPAKSNGEQNSTLAKSDGEQNVQPVKSNGEQNVPPAKSNCGGPQGDAKQSWAPTMSNETNKIKSTTSKAEETLTTGVDTGYLSHSNTRDSSKPGPSNMEYSSILAESNSENHADSSGLAGSMGKPLGTPNYADSNIRVSGSYHGHTSTPEFSEETGSSRFDAQHNMHFDVSGEMEEELSSDS